MRPLLAICLWVSAFPSFVCCQTGDLLRNPDITWVAEYTSDYVMNPADEDGEYPPLNYLDVIRFECPAPASGLYGKRYMSRYLSARLLNLAQTPGFQCYTDSLVQKVMTGEQLSDRINIRHTGHNQCSPEEITWTEEVHLDDIRCFRVRQIFWYDRKKRAFDGMPVSFAPVVNTLDSNGEVNGARSLFWLKAGRNESKRLENTQFSYVFQTKMAGNAPGPADMKTLKGSLGIRNLTEEEITNPSRQRLDAGEFSPLSTEQLMKQCYITDTVITYNPETYDDEPTVTYEHRNYLEQVDKIRFVQNWYYDERRKSLLCRLTGIAPLAAIRDSEGVFRYYKPLFYVMYR